VEKSGHGARIVPTPSPHRGHDQSESRPDVSRMLQPRMSRNQCKWHRSLSTHQAHRKEQSDLQGRPHTHPPHTRRA